MINIYLTTLGIKELEDIEGFFAPAPVPCLESRDKNEIFLRSEIPIAYI